MFPEESHALVGPGMQKKETPKQCREQKGSGLAVPVNVHVKVPNKCKGERPAWAWTPPVIPLGP